MAKDEYERMFKPKLRAIIAGVHDGLKDKEIASVVGLTEHTTKNYLREIYDTLGLWNRLELALWYEANIQNLCA